MKIRCKFFFFIFLLLLGCSSCRKNHYNIRVSTIKADIEIKRLEKDLFTMKPEEITVKLPDLKAKYGTLLQLFSYAINTGEVNDSSFGDFLVRFCTDKQNADVFGLTMKTFPDLTNVERKLEDAFRHYKYYFPKKVVPEVFSCITGFNASIITMSGKAALGIGLDKYLGADCEYYPGLGIYTYMAARMTPDFIVPDCMYGWSAFLWDFTSLHYPSDNVLAEMIHEGKLKYFERCMIPEAEDEIIFGFKPSQMKFCRNNEGQMWQYMVENDLIFKTDQFTIRKLVGDAPFTSYFTNESPGRAAVWLGFRIIESYMMKNPDVKLEDLMNNTDVQGLLEKAKYSPQ
jgi:hypothetical protein